MSKVLIQLEDTGDGCELTLKADTPFPESGRKEEFSDAQIAAVTLLSAFTAVVGADPRQVIPGLKGATGIKIGRVPHAGAARVAPKSRVVVVENGVAKEA